MRVGTNSAPSSPAELLGDPHPLLEQLGSADDLAVAVTLEGAVDFHRVSSLPSLRAFLHAYRADVLVPIELPSIVNAHACASRSQLRELIALDQQLSKERALRPFAAASYRVGQRQLSRLRPMRDQRLVQRYLAAIEAGDARGWHTLVFGVSLAMFSLPLRQGLQHYVEQTINGFVESAARSLHLAEAERASLLSEHSATIPACLNAALSHAIR
jgi:urease accessory protein UreF